VIMNIRVRGGERWRGERQIDRKTQRQKKKEGARERERESVRARARVIVWDRKIECGIEQAIKESGPTLEGEQ